MIKRFIFKDVECTPFMYDLYALYEGTEVPVMVGRITCPEARDLILQAPALDQLRRANKRIDSKKKRELRIREYKDTTASFIEGMAKWLKKL